MLRKYNVWRADIRWSCMKIHLHPEWKIMVPVWIIPAVVGEVIWRLMGGQLFGVIVGLFASSLKTLIDYAIVMLDCRTVTELKKRRSP
ncbi:MAG: hypothetical protein R6U10_02930 [Thermoplasmatota archaeon]